MSKDQIRRPCVCFYPFGLPYLTHKRLNCGTNRFTVQHAGAVDAGT